MEKPTSKHRNAVKVDSKMFQCTECKKQHTILKASIQNIGVMKGSGDCKKVVICPHCNWKDCIESDAPLPSNDGAGSSGP